MPRSNFALFARRASASRFSRDGWVFEFKYDESPDLEGVTSQVLK